MPEQKLPSAAAHSSLDEHGSELSLLQTRHGQSAVPAPGPSQSTPEARLTEPVVCLSVILMPDPEMFLPPTIGQSRLYWPPPNPGVVSPGTAGKLGFVAIASHEMPLWS